MFAATQQFLTLVFEIVTICSLCGLLIEFAYFTASYPTGYPFAPSKTAPNPVPVSVSSSTYPVAVFRTPDAEKPALAGSLGG
jgi:hypothetical protein